MQDMSETLPQVSLNFLEQNPWRQVFQSKNDQVLITLTGFHFDAVEYLLQCFAPVYEDYTSFIDTGGHIVQKISHTRRPHFNRPEDCLDLLLVWSRTHGSLMVLELIVTLWDDIYMCFKVPQDI